MKQLRDHIIIILLLAIYLIFPSHNSSVDAYYYAASIKYGGELFHPHHLLYNFTGYLAMKLLNIAGIEFEVISLMKSLNAVIAFLSLFILRKVLIEMNRHPVEISGILLIVGSSFAICRYATENETYLLPLLLSLLASLFFLRFINDRRNFNLVISGILAAGAILFHQIHFFWWLGLLTGICYHYRKARFGFLYGLPAFIIPLVYMIVFISWSPDEPTSRGFLQFVFREFYSGGIEKEIGWPNIYLTVINFVRSFVQVHGLMLVVARDNFFFLVPAGLASVLVLASVLQRNFIRKNAILSNRVFINIHILILLLQLAFAFFSVGNAEFMVMIPLLIFILITEFYNIRKFSLVLLGMSLLIWNFNYGIIPARYFQTDNHDQIILRALTNRNDLFIVKSDQHLISKIYYKTGVEDPGNIQKAPGNMLRRKQPLSLLEERIDRTLTSGNRVFTDCITYPGLVSRASFLDGEEDEIFFDQYRSIRVDSISTRAGVYYLHEIIGVRTE